MNPSLLARLLATSLTALVMCTTAVAGHNTSEAIEARTVPEGKLNVVESGGGVVVASAADAPVNGEAVYKSVCAVCHDSGIAGAPKTGDVDAWVTRVAQGMAVLVDHAINGFQGETGVMIARGGNPALSDAEVEAAVKHMVELSQ